MHRPLTVHPHARRILLRLLNGNRRADQQGAVTVAAGLVAALVLILSGAAVVTLASSNLRGFASSDRAGPRRGGRGRDLMIDTWNQPQNRRLLVSGADPGAWTRTNALRSPCFDVATNTRPGPDGTGLPDQAAIDLGDGAWRDAVTGAAANATQRPSFRLVRVSSSPPRQDHPPRRAPPAPRRRLTGAPCPCLPAGMSC